MNCIVIINKKSATRFVVELWELEEGIWYNTQLKANDSLKEARNYARFLMEEEGTNILIDRSIQP